MGHTWSPVRRHLFFDLDGTLTDSREGIVACMRHALEALSVDVPSDDEMARLIGMPLKEALGMLLGTDRMEWVPRSIELYRERFRTKGMYENAVYPGVSEGLPRLVAAGFTLWVVTSKPRIFAERIVEHFELAKYFERVHGSELSGEYANKVDLILHVLRTEKIRPEQAVMIGDRYYDVVGALGNGVAPLGVLWGYGSRNELLEAGAEAVHETFGDLELFLRTHEP
jgi:phosphoglycolate phosphatase